VASPTVFPEEHARQARSRSFLPTGDAAHLRTNIEGGVPCPDDPDTISAYRSIQRIQHVGAGHGADIWVMHDPGDREKFGTLSQPYK
jgi:hypothetical protein